MASRAEISGHAYKQSQVDQTSLEAAANTATKEANSELLAVCTRPTEEEEPMIDDLDAGMPNFAVISRQLAARRRILLARARRKLNATNRQLALYPDDSQARAHAERLTKRIHELEKEQESYT